MERAPVLFRLLNETEEEAPLTTSEIVAWVFENIQLGDARRSRALGEMAWALIEAGVVSLAEIGRHLKGKADPASQIRRVFRFCSNEHVDPHVVQQALVRLLVGRALRGVPPEERIAMVAIDWHTYDNGAVSGLRVSLITGSRALPLLWHEVRTKDLGGQQTLIEHQMIRTLQECRPDGVEWLMLLDSGFHSSELLDLLDETGYFIVRSGVAPMVHCPGGCWCSVGDLPVKLGEIVEFGHVYWSSKHPRKVRLVAGRIAMGRKEKKGRRSSHRNYTYTQPGFCALVTNLPYEENTANDVLRLYGRRFEIEHSFRDIKNATLGMDMEHVHLREMGSYRRLMCIVAVAEAVRWLMGAEAESVGLHKKQSPSRPKDGSRVLSCVNVGQRCRKQIKRSISAMIRDHLSKAIVTARSIVTKSWRQLTQSLELPGLARRPEDLAPLKGSCKRRRRDRIQPCIATPLQPQPVTVKRRVAA